LIIFRQYSFGQDDSKVIYTKDGKILGPKRAFLTMCKKGYAAPPDNKIVNHICECQVNLLDRRYTTRQIRDYEKRYHGEGFSQLLQEDTLLQRQTRECTKDVNEVLLLSIPAYRQSFVSKCIDNLKLKSEKPLNDTLAAVFCNCAANIMEQRKVTIERFDELLNPSSLLYNEIAYKCGSPFLQASDFAKDWKASNANDIVGPDIDTVQVISIMGMHKIKIRLGDEIRIWLIDSGASDLLVSDGFAAELKAKKLFSELDFIGEGQYVLADNRLVSCKRYKVDGLQIGHLKINNVILSVSKEAKEFLVGKSLLNKFTSWSLDNKNNVLILRK
jgi:hypothetical protein